MDPSKHAPLRIMDIRSKYKVIDKVGKGTYGTVFKVLNLQDNKYYAIKKFQNTEAKLQVEGFPITALRQISLLKQLNHPNIVNLQEIICSKPNKRNLYRGSTFMVFNYMDHDFAGLFRSKIKFSVPEIKCIMKQLLEGCGFLHQNKVMHRDIKSANILLDDRGVVQLADFGLGRRTRFDSVYTYKVVTLWYRAPELLLGCKTYNHKVDVWSIGCVFAELLTGEVFFKKETQYAIIEKIYEICGDLDENEYTEEYLRGCVYYHDMKPKKQYKNMLEITIRKLCPTIDNLTVKFLQGLLELNPYKRLSCEQALNHQFFRQQPRACTTEQIHKLDVEYHEMFRDRSLKIDRKERKKSLDWSDQENKKKIKQQISEVKPHKQEERQSKPYIRTQKEDHNGRTYDRYPDSRYDRDRYEERKHSYTKAEYSSSKKHEDYKSKKKYSRSPTDSQSSSSSSRSPSRRSRSRNKRHHHEDRHEKKSHKNHTYYERDRQTENVRKEKESRKHIESNKDRYEQKDKSKYNSNKGYDQRIQTHKKQSSSKPYHEESRFYKDKNSDYKDRDRKETDYLDRKHDSSKYEKYPKQDYGRTYSKPSKERYPQERSSQPRRSQKYDSMEYRQRRDSRDVSDRYSKSYQAKDSRQYSKKQYYQSSQKYHQERKPYKQKDRQYRKDREHRDYDKSSYDYQRKQSRNRDDSRYKDESRYKEESRYKDESRLRDYQFKKISIQNHQQPQRKKLSPNKKDMDLQY